MSASKLLSPAPCQAPGALVLLMSPWRRRLQRMRALFKQICLTNYAEKKTTARQPGSIREAGGWRGQGGQGGRISCYIYVAKSETKEEEQGQTSFIMANYESSSV